MDGWDVERYCPAGRAHFAWGGHFVAGIPFGHDKRMGPSVGRNDLPSTRGSSFEDFLAEVGVVLVDPVLTGRSKDVEVYGVFECGGGVGKVGWDDKDLVGVDGVGGTVIVVKAKAAFEDEGQLFVDVRVAGYDAAFGEHDAGKHGLGAGDELTGEEGVELFGFDFAPAVESCGRHGRAFLSVLEEMIRGR